MTFAFLRVAPFFAATLSILRPLSPVWRRGLFSAFDFAQWDFKCFISGRGQVALDHSLFLPPCPALYFSFLFFLLGCFPSSLFSVLSSAAAFWLPVKPQFFHSCTSPLLGQKSISCERLPQAHNSSRCSLPSFPFSSQLKGRARFGFSPFSPYTFFRNDFFLFTPTPPVEKDFFLPSFPARDSATSPPIPLFSSPHLPSSQDPFLRVFFALFEASGHVFFSSFPRPSIVCGRIRFASSK